MGLQERVNEWVSSILDGYRPEDVRDHKAIHEPLLGTNLFYRHEVAVLGSPLIQRLRHIRQTGFAFLTYPSAVHTRFEHTLGAMVLATRYARRIKETNPPRPITIDPEKGDLAEIRMAALLHDCGHTFLSHASEQIYEKHDDIHNLQSTVGR